MKKRNVILLFFIVILIALTTNVMAEDEACKITMSADKTTVKSGDIVTVNLLMSNINKSTGIARFGGILEYPEDIFEIVYKVSIPAVKDEAEKQLSYHSHQERLIPQHSP